MTQARRGSLRAGLFIELWLYSLLHQNRHRLSCSLKRLIFRKDFACKAKEARLRVAPGFTLQSRLAAGFLEKLLARQTMFDRNLWQKQTFLRVEHDQQTVTPDLNRFRRYQRRRRKQRNFDREIVEQ